MTHTLSTYHRCCCCAYIDSLQKKITHFFIFVFIFSLLLHGLRKVHLTDGVVFFAKYFGRTQEETYKIMAQHPHMKHFSIAAIKNCIELLQMHGFSLDDIFVNFYITIYPM